MNLTIDIGNTCTKLTVIENGQVVDFFRTDTLSEMNIEQLLDNFPLLRELFLSRPSRGRL